MKVAIPIDIERFKKEIELAESTQTFANQTALFEYIANTTWGKTAYKKPLTAAVLYLRYKQEALIIKTPKGKRGRATGTAVNRTARKDKLANHPMFKENIRLLKRNHPSLVKTIDKLAGGNLRATIKLNCLDCCGGDKKLASECNVTDCPWLLYNPFLKCNKTTAGEDE